MSKEQEIYTSGWQRYGDGPHSGPVVNLKSLVHIEEQWITLLIVDADSGEDENDESPLTPEQEDFEVFTPKWLLPGSYPKA